MCLYPPHNESCFMFLHDAHCRCKLNLLIRGQSPDRPPFILIKWPKHVHVADFPFNAHTRTFFKENTQMKHEFTESTLPSLTDIVSRRSHDVPSSSILYKPTSRPQGSRFSLNNGSKEWRRKHRKQSLHWQIIQSLKHADPLRKCLWFSGLSNCIVLWLSAPGHLSGHSTQPSGPRCACCSSTTVCL